MKKRLLLIAFVSLVLATGLGGVLSEQAAALTEFNCTVNATDSQGKSINVSGVQCAALVVYATTDEDGVILETGESQNLIRSCKIVGNSTACTESFDDSDVTIALPVGFGIGNVTSVETTASKLRIRGCVRNNLRRETGADGYVNKVDLTYNISCP